MSSITETAAMMKMVNIFCFSKLISSYNYSGLSALETTKLEPKSCSQRLCYYKDALLSSTWISSKVIETNSELTLLNNFNISFRFCLDVTAALWMVNLCQMDIHGCRMERSMVKYIGSFKVFLVSYFRVLSRRHCYKVAG